ncbi:hypothetical protein C1645_840740 [Glomus cerebriforme]|uniref:Uncharacterized protein n=1 Tax=Glomus cerebriforme TaxID=658196 RepID=A0A397S3X5_9GLOM|nr:hypothetical protein C1645_840740 [Glomus cerebriforme]
MSDSESISSDNSNNESFSNDFIESIPDDSESSDSEDYDFSYGTNVSSLTLEVGLSIKLWAHQQDFFVCKGRFEKVQSKLKKQSHCEGIKIDQENVGQIGNPIIRHPKGRPPAGTARFRGPLET